MFDHPVSAIPTIFTCCGRWVAEYDRPSEHVDQYQGLSKK